MTRPLRLALPIGILLALFTAPQPLAHAACSADEAGGFGASTAVNGILLYGDSQAGQAQCSSAQADLPAAATPDQSVQLTDWDLDTKCVRSALSSGADPYSACALPPADDPVAASAAPQVTPGLALTALRRVPLPESRLLVQPPDGETLVNFETNFYTKAGPFTRSLQMLGRQVDLRIRPSRFEWRFGDGSSRQTTSPGAAYPQLEITHAYRRAGQVSPAVDTTYSAEFRVDGRAWRTVPGTVTMTGRPETLQVRTARPTLVGPQ